MNNPQPFVFVTNLEAWKDKKVAERRNADNLKQVFGNHISTARDKASLASECVNRISHDRDAYKSARNYLTQAQAELTKAIEALPTV